MTDAANEAATAPELYTIADVMARLRLGRSVIFEELRAGRLRSVHRGRSRRIPSTAVAEYIALLEREEAEREQ